LTQINNRLSFRVYSRNYRGEEVVQISSKRYGTSEVGGR